MIIKCNICGAWLASSNSKYIEEHKYECGKEEVSVSNNQVVIRLNYHSRYDYKKIAKCIVEVKGERFTATVLHLRGGRFRILNTNVSDYKHLIGKIIDASDICQVLLQ